eukprot:6990378-Prorocentrum_lima.AAC.1
MPSTRIRIPSQMMQRQSSRTQITTSGKLSSTLVRRPTGICMNTTVTPKDVGDTSQEDPREHIASTTDNGLRSEKQHLNLCVL